MTTERRYIMSWANNSFPESGGHNELVTERTVLSQIYQLITIEIVRFRSKHSDSY